MGDREKSEELAMIYTHLPYRDRNQWHANLSNAIESALRSAREDERKRCLSATFPERALEDYSTLKTTGTGRDHYLFARGWDMACSAIARAIESGSERAE